MDIGSREIPRLVSSAALEESLKKLLSTCIRIFQDCKPVKFVDSTKRSCNDFDFLMLLSTNSSEIAKMCDRDHCILDHTKMAMLPRWLPQEQREL